MVRRNSKTFVIVVAAGSGSRYGGEVPKQFLDLDGMPVLAHSVLAFAKVFPGCGLYIVLSPDGRERWNKFCATHHGVPTHTIVSGGATRAQSVANAVKEVARNSDLGNSVIMVHDGARPIIDPCLLSALHAAAEQGAAAAPALEVSDSIVEITGERLECVCRDRFRTVQTPQVFPGAVLADAFSRYESDSAPQQLTDDISIVRRYAPAVPVTLVPGSRRNIKITRRGDLELAKFYLENPNF